MKLTPAWVASFESAQQQLIIDAWKEREKSLIWDELMSRKTSTTLRELYFFLLETARIYPEGQGGNKRYDDISATYFEIDNANSGAGLLLTKNEIEDNVMARPGMNGMKTMDYAQSWSRQIGGNGAYYPQQTLFYNLLANATTANGYDGVPFFSANHPVNPLVSVASGGTSYPNLIAAKPLATATPSPGSAAADLIFAAGQNLTAVIAAGMAFTQPNGFVRLQRPKYLLHDPTNLYMVQQLIGASSKFFNANSNPFIEWGIQPICAPELAGSPGVWYLVFEFDDAEGGPFIFQDREPYYLTSYSADSQVELNRRKEYEWLYDGRNASAYGHPYKIIRANPT